MFDENFLGEVINSSYELTDLIARGGMATVYRGHQISMNRDVAIKILPREFLHEPAFRERFKQEAAIAAHLEHRAIVPVYDYGEWQGVPYIVMRYMDGRSLDILIEQEPLPLDRLQDIIRQVASGLDYAHAQGVLHRDLKPSNILLDRVGDAYITDFGIARLLSSNEKLTATGVVGTPSYMSPEQAQGHTLDGRSDIYALGVVIFETLTGKRPFEGDTPYSVAVMQVTKTPPSPRLFNPDIPPGVERVILKALEKDPAHRFQTAAELAGALDDADLMPPLAQTVPRSSPYLSTTHMQPTPPRMMTPISLGAPASIQQTRQVSPLLYLGIALVIALLVGGVLLAGYYILSDTTLIESPNFAATGIVRLTATAEAVVPAARDGRLLFVAEHAGQPDLYVLNLATGNETRLTDTPGTERAPAVSPDGEWVAYLYTPDNGQNGSQVEIYLRRMDGSEFRQVTSNLVEEGAPAWMPDGEAIIFTQAADGGSQFRLIRYEVDAKEETTLYQLVGGIRPLSIAPDGQSTLFTTGEGEAREIAHLNLNTGQVTPLTANTAADWSPQWNPDGAKILFLRAGVDGAALMEMRADGTGQVQIYDGEGQESSAVYSPDGEQIVFCTAEDGIQKMFIITADGQDVRMVDEGYSPVWIP